MSFASRLPRWAVSPLDGNRILTRHFFLERPQTRRQRQLARPKIILRKWRVRWRVCIVWFGLYFFLALFYISNRLLLVPQEMAVLCNIRLINLATWMFFIRMQERGFHILEQLKLWERRITNTIPLTTFCPKSNHFSNRIRGFEAFLILEWFW